MIKSKIFLLLYFFAIHLNTLAEDIVNVININLVNSSECRNDKNSRCKNKTSKERVIKIKKEISKKENKTTPKVNSAIKNEEIITSPKEEIEKSKDIISKKKEIYIIEENVYEEDFEHKPIVIKYRNFSNISTRNSDDVILPEDCVDNCNRKLIQEKEEIIKLSKNYK